MILYGWVTFLCACALATSAPPTDLILQAEGFGDFLRIKDQIPFVPDRNLDKFVEGESKRHHNILTVQGSRPISEILDSPISTNLADSNFRRNEHPSPSLLYSNVNTFQSSRTSPQNHILSEGNSLYLKEDNNSNNKFISVLPSTGNFGSADNFQRVLPPNSGNTYKIDGSQNQNQNFILNSTNPFQGGLVSSNRNKLNSGNQNSFDNAFSLNDNSNNYDNTDKRNVFVKDNSNYNNNNAFNSNQIYNNRPATPPFQSQQSNDRQISTYISSNPEILQFLPFPDSGFGNFESNLASTEDIHTDTDNINSFGISSLSNDGINKNIGTSQIPHVPLSHSEVVKDEPQQLFTVKVEDDDDSFETSAFNSDQTFGIPLPSSIVAGSSSSNLNSGQVTTVNNDIFQTPFSTIADAHQNNDPFTSEPFGIPLLDVTSSSSPEVSDSGITVIPEANMEAFLKEHQGGSSSGDNNSFSALQPTPVKINLPDETSLNNQEGNDILQLESISPLNENNLDSSQVSDLLGDLTIGELLMGINGQNGIMVLPMASVNNIKQSDVPTLQTGEFEVSRETGNSEAVTVHLPLPSTIISTEVPTTRRRPSRRRTTPKPPDHIRVTFSDLLYAKGQWFGTLLGGLIDFGRITMDAFKKNLGSSSRDSYA